MSSNSIAKAFDMTPLGGEPDIILPKINQAKSSTSKVMDDFEFVRDGLIDLSKTLDGAVQETASLASMSQDPDQFDVLSKLATTRLQTLKGILEVQKQIRSIDQGDVEGKPQVINNNLFIGSTDQLQKFLQDKSKK